MEEKDNITQELLETIEGYLNGTMTSPELKHFKARLEEEPQLHQQVEDVRLMLQGIEQAALAEKLEDFHASISEETDEKVIPIHNTSSRRRFTYWGIAASLVAVIGLFWVFGRQNESEKLFATYFVPDPGLPTNMGEMENFEFYDAMVDYKQGNYGEAIEKWSNQLMFKTESDTLHYFIGVAQLAQGDEEAAIEHLEPVTHQTQSIFLKEAWYYLGLAQLKQENFDAAKKSLELSNNANAGEILSELNN